uniref:Uncharacterized protein n=1 Tax=Podoviridae sp. ctxqo3 TaxID=2827755 RepID=A0A8S5SZ32_9CAUD|nr:MAG TPA: hypothetical protein [Podoviridae sp. ctxqo3]
MKLGQKHRRVLNNYGNYNCRRFTISQDSEAALFMRFLRDFVCIL